MNASADLNVDPAVQVGDRRWRLPENMTGCYRLSARKSARKKNRYRGRIFQ
jgi:hypothetical protein